jgi:phage recombination protein Bet
MSNTETNLALVNHATTGVSRQFSLEQVDLLKRTIAKGTTDDEFSLFLHVCNRTGLDPFLKQIHCVKRWSAKDQREVMAIQTGIDGYRLTAQRTLEYAGNDDAVFDGDEQGHPLKATVTVWRLVNGARQSFTASARWSEYVQKKKDGGLVDMWARMPYGMLAKCAESLALRKAFPAELSGLNTDEEMGGTEEDRGPKKPVPIKAALRERIMEHAAELKEKPIDRDPDEEPPSDFMADPALLQAAKAQEWKETLLAASSADAVLKHKAEIAKDSVLTPEAKELLQKQGDELLKILKGKR